MLTEQTQIAKNLGISMNSLHRMLHASGFETPENFKLINNKRHYEYEDILKLIKSNVSNWPIVNNKKVKD